jgi:hypothetical protein
VFGIWIWDRISFLALFVAFGQLILLFIHSNSIFLHWPQNHGGMIWHSLHILGTVSLPNPKIYIP